MYAPKPNSTRTYGTCRRYHNKTSLSLFSLFVVDVPFISSSTLQRPLIDMLSTYTNFFTSAVSVTVSLGWRYGSQFFVRPCSFPIRVALSVIFREGKCSLTYSCSFCQSHIISLTQLSAHYRIQGFSQHLGQYPKKKEDAAVEELRSVEDK